MTDAIVKREACLARYRAMTGHRDQGIALCLDLEPDTGQALGGGGEIGACRPGCDGADGAEEVDHD